jgi:hypothetical protein
MIATQTTDDLGNMLKTSWTLLVNNLIVIVPGLVLTALVGAIVVVCVVAGIGAVVAAGASKTGATPVLATVITLYVALLAVSIALLVAAGIAGTAFATGMAARMWQTGTATLADGWVAFERRGGQLFVLALLMVVIGFVAVLLAPITLLLSLLAFAVFFIYVSAAVVIGERSATEAIAESCRLARGNFAPTLLVALMVIGVSVVGNALGGELARVQPIIGAITSIVVGQAAVTYGAILIAGEYMRLRALEAPVVSNPPPAPSVA